jgi:hypothetical protein
MPQHFHITSRVRLKAASAGPQAKRRFVISAYTGGKLRVGAYELPIVVDLKGLQLASQRCPVLYDHGGICELEDDEKTPDQKNYLVGQTTKIVATDSSLEAEGFFLSSTAIGREIQAIAADDYEFQASIGADPDEAHLEELADGDTAEVNGQTITGPCLISRRTRLGEISFVVFGADDQTVARIAAKLPRSKAKRTIKATSSKDAAMDFKTWVKDVLKLDPEALSEEQLAAAQTTFDMLPAEGDGEEGDLTASEDPEEDPNAPPVKAAKGKGKGKAKPVKAKPAPAPIKASKPAQEAAAEHRRIAGIEAAAKGHPKIIAAALERGWSIDRTKLAVLRATRAKAPAPEGSGMHTNRVDLPALEAALLMSTGISAKQAAKWYGDKTVDKATGKDHRGLTLHYLMDRVIEAAGEHYRGSRKTEGFIRAALAAERKILAAGGGGFSSVSLSNILENVAQKSLLAGYEAIEVTWPEFCATSSHTDFKPKARYRLDATGSFKKVGPDGELKHIGLSDAKYSNQIDTFGALISLTRQMQINDDLGAFTELPKMLGRMAAIRVEEAVYIALLGMVGSGFFATGNRNYKTGTDGALSIGGITLVEQMFFDQVDSNKKPILLTPKILLCPSTLKVTADQLNKEQTIVATTTANKPLPANNPHVGKYKVVSSTYLNNTAIRDQDGVALTGQSDTGWYLFADPGNRAAITVGFLNGQQQPTVQSSDEVFTTLGMQWRAFSDFGIGEEDPVAAVFATGVVAP